MTDVFISHCPKDKDIADTLCGFLTERGFMCMTSGGFTARADAAPVSHISALSAMRAFIFIYSDNSINSGRVARQLELALNKPGTAVLPYRVNNAPISEKYAKVLMSMNRIDAYPSRNDLRLEQLCTSVSWLLRGTVPNVPYTCTYTYPYPYSYPYYARPKRNGSVPIFAAACAAVFAGSVFMTLLCHNISSKMHKDAEPAYEQMTASVSEEVRETAAFNFSTVYIGSDYSGEYRGEVGENGLPDGKGVFRGSSCDESSSRSIEYSGEFKNGAITGKGKCRCELAGGDSYEFDGYFENGMMSGRGSCEYSYIDSELTKETYEGLWHNNNTVSDYKETEYYSDGTVREYIGELKNGVWVGKGCLRKTYTSGDVKERFYQGTWVNDSLEGNVIELTEFVSGDVCEYTGGYSNNTWNGDGVKIYTYASGSGDIKEVKHEGTWTDGVLSGRIKKTTSYENGDVKVYEGDCADSDLNGKGVETRTYKKGKIQKRVMEGEWKDGVYNGKGVMTRYYKPSEEKTADEIWIYEGVWTDGILSGTVTSTEKLVSGKTIVYVGGYENDKRQGDGVLTCTYPRSEKDIKKKVVEGTWDSGKLSGTVNKTLYYKNGDTEEYCGEYSECKKNGEGTVIFTDHSSGEKWTAEGRFENDSFTDGTKTYYDKEGKITASEKYRSGIAVEAKK